MYVCQMGAGYSIAYIRKVLFIGGQCIAIDIENAKYHAIKNTVLVPAHQL